MTYEEKQRRLRAELQAGGTGVALNKHRSNLFRDHRRGPATKCLEVEDLRAVLQVDAREGWVDAEGMIPYEELAAATLRAGVMPAVVPELKSIILGGAVAGVGVESSSFKYGLVHETVLAMDILLGDGRVVTCTPDNEHRDLFFGFPNSYGTLGYALRLKVKTVPVKPFVQLTHLCYAEPEGYFRGNRSHPSPPPRP